jgi:tight adherence protein B
MLLVILVFLLGTGAVLGGYAAITRVPGRKADRELARRLRDISSPADDPLVDASVLKLANEGPLPAIDRMVVGSRGGLRLTRLIEQSGYKTSASAMILITIGMACAAAFIVKLFTPLPFIAPIVALIAGAMPIGFLMNRRSARMGVFEERFPEALDLMARALRAGHAFQSAMGMVAEELHAPIGPEFKKTFDQQNYGLPLRESLTQLTDRVPLLDVRFFVTAVLIQRDTGGNLSEILDNLAHVVRERFKVQRQVRVHTAHGRFTAFVLLSLPPGLAIILMFINPNHMEPLFHEKMGQMMLGAASVMQLIGFIWIRKVIKIEV